MTKIIARNDIWTKMFWVGIAVLIATPGFAKENANSKVKFGTYVGVSGRSCDTELDAKEYRDLNLPTATKWLNQLKSVDVRIHMDLISVEGKSKVCETSFLESVPGYVEFKNGYQPAIALENWKTSANSVDDLKNMRIFFDSVEVFGAYQGKELSGKFKKSENEISAIYFSQLFHPLVRNQRLEEMKIQNIVNSIINIDGNLDQFRIDAAQIGYPNSEFSRRNSILDYCFIKKFDCQDATASFSKDAKLQMFFDGRWLYKSESQKQASQIIYFLARAEFSEKSIAELAKDFTGIADLDIVAEIKKYPFNVISCAYSRYSNLEILDKCIAFAKYFNLDYRTSPESVVEDLFKVAGDRPKENSRYLIENYYMDLNSMNFIVTNWNQGVFTDIHKEFKAAADFYGKGVSDSDRGYSYEALSLKNELGEEGYSLIVEFLNVLNSQNPGLVSKSQKRKLNSQLKKMDFLFFKIH
ncbi:MAG: hypothetical protein AB8E15_02450 [Bdellovibrionales bacterium]